MIHLNKLKNIISENNNLKITFVGAFNHGGQAALYTYNGRFSLNDKRLVCGKAIPKSHGNCFKCYSENIENKF